MVAALGCRPDAPPAPTDATGSPTPTGDTATPTTLTTPVSLRVATFNAALAGRFDGELADRLADGDDDHAAVTAAILQRVRPDVVLLNELDRDDDGLALARFVDDYLAVAQGPDLEPLDYPYRLAPPVNTGLSSGVDLDGDGVIVTEPGSEAYAADAFGFGLYEGQYGLVVLSRLPFDPAEVRTFQTMRWVDLPDAWLPEDYYSDEALAVLRLSSKTHADVPIEVGGQVVHLLVSHPTPPSFDGAEDRNGRRNHDEIAFWSHYLDGENASYLVDDQARGGGLQGEHFVIVGDLNADPMDGDSSGDAVDALVAHPRVADPRPTSLGAVEQATNQGGANDLHRGDPALDTADFSDSAVGNLRVDYALPSASMQTDGAGVFWPTEDDPDFAWVGRFPFPGSDHRLVWVDLTVEP